MAIVWHVLRDKTEAVNPPTVDGVMPIEGGILARHDDVTDMVRYSFYILIRAGAAAGTYAEAWRVQEPDGSALQVRQAFNINEAVVANTTEMLLIAPATAVNATGAARSVSIGNVADPSDAQLIAGVSGFSSAIANQFSREVTRTVFNSDVEGSHIQAEFA